MGLCQKNSKGDINAQVEHKGENVNCESNTLPDKPEKDINPQGDPQGALVNSESNTTGDEEVEKSGSPPEKPKNTAEESITEYHKYGKSRTHDSEEDGEKNESDAEESEEEKGEGNTEESSSSSSEDEKDNYIKHASSKDTLTEESESETDGESVVDLGNYKKDIPVVKLEASETEDSESDSPSSANDSGIE